MNKNTTNTVVEYDPSESGTKDRILDAAEKLFALNGFDSSHREITKEAGVNLGAINYHFKTKNDLILAVILRRLQPINQKRLEMLDAAEKSAVGKSPTVEQILESFFRPMLEMLIQNGVHGHYFFQIMIRALSDTTGLTQTLMSGELSMVIGRFMKAMMGALPEFTHEEIFWKMNFSLGSVAFALGHLHQIEIFSAGRLKQPVVEDIIQWAVKFTSTGMRAPFERHK